MSGSLLYNRMLGEVEKIRLIDTHEHLQHPHQLVEQTKIDFGRLFMHYASSDLISAGMPPEDMAEVRNPDSEWDIDRKWRATRPWYERSWNTAYCRCIRTAIRDLFGIEDLGADTVGPLSERMNSIPRETWTREVFDKAGVDIALEHSFVPEPIYPRRRYPELFLFDIVETFSFVDIPSLPNDTGLEVSSLRDYLGVIDCYFDRYADEASAFKIARAYDRPIHFEDVSDADASRVFDQFIKAGDRMACPDIRVVEDFIVHHCIRRATEHNLPVKVHTGLQEGNCNNVTNSRVSLLIDLFIKYPKTTFDIYHMSWPYTDELLAICKNFPNVYIDMCWSWIVDPPASRRYLGDMLETVPLNKIHGFGGDFIFVEGSYGHAVMARREIARVLAEKVEEGVFTEEYAVKAAGRILRENAIETFRVEEKRALVAERAARESGKDRQ